MSVCVCVCVEKLAGETLNKLQWIWLLIVLSTFMHMTRFASFYRNLFVVIVVTYCRQVETVAPLLLTAYRILNIYSTITMNVRTTDKVVLSSDFRCNSWKIKQKKTKPNSVRCTWNEIKKSSSSSSNNMLVKTFKCCRHFIILFQIYTWANTQDTSIVSHHTQIRTPAQKRLSDT